MTLTGNGSEKLLKAREQRVRPRLDDKILLAGMR